MSAEHCGKYVSKLLCQVRKEKEPGIEPEIFKSLERLSRINETMCCDDV
jgi:hypothetical protein